MGKRLYYGDNLKVLRNEFPDESVDLIYLDPPFNSNRDYNQIFNKGDNTSQAQVAVFEDTWNWDHETEELYFETISKSTNERLSKLLVAFKDFLGPTKMMAYVTMMAPRLFELHRVLKKNGSLFLHCDPTASHYLKLLLDAVFDVKNYRNEIIWCYRQGGRGRKKFAKKHDTIFFYSKNNKYTFNLDDIRVPYHGSGSFVRQGTVINGKRYKPNPKGKIPEDWWLIEALNPMSSERVGYPTQKPLELLERIIKACSNSGDVVLDPFCGCGTSIIASEKLGRNWIGIDITHISIATIKYRIERDLGYVPDYDIKGEPADLDGAFELANEDRHQFQIWALSKLGIRSTNEWKKGADGGIDGIQFFRNGDEVGKSIAQVKSGKVSVKDVRELYGVVKREGAKIGVLITLNKPTRVMVKEASTFGLFTINSKSFPVIRVVEVEEILNGKVRIDDLLPS
jgi:site-specific DNA-methyltransferase (adenine-specific)